MSSPGPEAWVIGRVLPDHDVGMSNPPAHIQDIYTQDDCGVVVLDDLRKAGYAVVRVGGLPPWLVDALRKAGYAVVKVGDVPPWMQRYGTVLDPEKYPHPYDHWTDSHRGGIDKETEDGVPVYRLRGTEIDRDHK